MILKLCSIVLFILLGAVRPAVAQSYLALSAGANRSELLLDPSPDFLTDAPRDGFMAGGIVGVELSRRWAVQIAPTYIEKGRNFTFVDGDSESVATSYRLTYVDLPLHLKWSLVYPTSGPYVMAGPSVAFRLEATRETSVGGATNERDVADSVAQMDLGVSVGAGVAFPLGRYLSFFVEGRFARGLVSINENGNDDGILFQSSDVTTQGLQVLGGLMFAFGGRGCH